MLAWWGWSLAGRPHQLLLGQALDVQLGALADLPRLDARLLLPPRIHLRACTLAETLNCTSFHPTHSAGCYAILCHAQGCGALYDIQTQGIAAPSGSCCMSIKSVISRDTCGTSIFTGHGTEMVIETHPASPSGCRDRP